MDAPRDIVRVFEKLLHLRTTLCEIEEWLETKGKGDAEREGVDPASLLHCQLKKRVITSQNLDEHLAREGRQHGGLPPQDLTST